MHPPYIKFPSETLQLGNNKLTNLPGSITKLTSLETLYLEDNDLMTLPKSIKKKVRKARIHD
ncbi:MAG: leucine-rich repeat domain-containing protein [Minisyncoccales bacterium]